VTASIGTAVVEPVGRYVVGRVSKRMMTRVSIVSPRDVSKRNGSSPMAG
jgi:hypothetical protein